MADMGMNASAITAEVEAAEAQRLQNEQAAQAQQAAMGALGTEEASMGDGSSATNDTINRVRGDGTGALPGWKVPVRCANALKG